MYRSHAMPFGAQVREDGRVDFQLWAPGATAIDLCLQVDSGEKRLPMSAESDGWFVLSTDQAAHGSRYCYVLPSGLRVPDPASRFQPGDVHGPSEVIDPRAWQWTDGNWRGRPWEEAVTYEIHVGTFSAEGTFAGVIHRLDYLVELGVTALELMPIADFHGTRNWGYDGVLPYAPDSSYGRPEDLKRLIQEAHVRGLMVFLDVVYNHFGPEGNYLHLYAPVFFSRRHHTPWGAAINFDGAGSDTVRRFFVHNALYWLEEYRFDGLRLDAVDTIRDDSVPDILEELAAAANAGPGRRRHIHLVLENDDNAARYLVRDEAGRPQYYRAQWNDDIHHVLHILLAGEAHGCLADYEESPIWYLGRCLAEGFAYQGEPSVYRGDAQRGEPSGGLPPTAFVSFMQNHDQAGNRPFGERISSLSEREPLRAVMALLLLAPAPPLLFMGEEYAAPQPFLFFCDFGPELATAVSAGRRREYARYQGFAALVERETLPEPNDPASFERSKLDWTSLEEPAHKEWLAFYRRLLTLRHREIVPRLTGLQTGGGEFRLLGEHGLQVQWRLGEESRLTLLANLGEARLAIPVGDQAAGFCLYVHPQDTPSILVSGELPPWSLQWFLDSGPTGSTSR